MNSVTDKTDSFPNLLQSIIRPRMRCHGCSLISNLRQAVITDIRLWKSVLIPIIIRRPQKSLGKRRIRGGRQSLRIRLCCGQRMPIERRVT